MSTTINSPEAKLETQSVENLTLTPKIHPLIKKFLAERETLFELARALGKMCIRDRFTTMQSIHRTNK